MRVFRVDCHFIRIGTRELQMRFQFSASNQLTIEKTRKLRLTTHNCYRLLLYSIWIFLSFSSFFLRSSLALQLHMCTHIDWCNLPDIEMNVWHSELWIVITCSSVAHVPEIISKTFLRWLLAGHLGKVVCVCQRQVNILCCHLSNRSMFAFYFNIISIRIDRRKKFNSHHIGVRARWPFREKNTSLKINQQKRTRTKV